MGIDVAATMLRASRLLDDAARSGNQALELEMPRLFRRSQAREQIDAAFAMAVEQAQRAVRELEPLGAPLEDARAGIRASIEQIDPRLRRDLARERAYSAVSDAVHQLGMHRDRLALRAELDGIPAAQVRSRLQGEVDAILELPNDAISAAQVRRIGLISALPAQQRPRFPELVRPNYPFDETGARGWHGTDSMVRTELDNLRIDQARRRIEADPASTRQSLEAELQAIIDVPDGRRTAADVERIAVIAGLDDALRPAVIDVPLPWPRYQLPQISAWNFDPAGANGVVGQKVDAIRMAFEQRAMLADPTVTRATVSRELVGILATPVSELTDAQLRRMSTLLRLPEHARPALPRDIDSHYRIADLGLLRYHPREHLKAAEVYAAGRLQLLADADPSVLVNEVRARVASGEALDLRAITAIAERDPTLLAKAGFDDAMLHERAIDALARGTHITSRDVGDHLALLRAGIAHVEPADAAQRALRDEVLALIDRNLDRINGVRSDTFGRHPDYGEVGRIAENARLLHVLGRASGDTVDDAAGAAGTLVW